MLSFVCYMSSHYRTFCTYMINQQVHIYKYAQSHIIITIIIIHKHVSVTFVTIIRVSYSKNTINIQ
jgi:hypothetical protein